MHQLEIFGYPTDQDELEKPLSLREVTFCCDPKQLRKIAKFIFETADEFEQLGPKFGHRHIQDWSDSWPPELPDIIIYNQGA